MTKLILILWDKMILKKLCKKTSFIIIAILLVLPLSYIVYKKYKSTYDYSTFSAIYEGNIWTEGSGPGSNPKNATAYLTILQDFFNDPKIKTYYDLGCGDWQLMELVNMPPNKEYFGFDVVSSVIEGDRKKYKKANVHFQTISGFSDFKNKKGDLLIVKDVLMHLPNILIHYFIDNILPNFKYALITHDISGIKTENNKNIEIGQWRPLDLEAEPFSLKDLKILTDYSAHDIKTKRVYLYVNEALVIK